MVMVNLIEDIKVAENNLYKIRHCIKDEEEIHQQQLESSRLRMVKILNWICIIMILIITIFVSRYLNREVLKTLNEVVGLIMGFYVGYKYF
jgi:hypothetical protein